MVVLPFVPGVTLLRAKTLFWNALSLATSKVYDSGRTPFELAFSTISRTGCCAGFSLAPGAGSDARGALISTPAIGPAIDGLSGFSLFSTPQPAAITVSRRTGQAATRRERRVTMFLPVSCRRARGG